MLVSPGVVLDVCVGLCSAVALKETGVSSGKEVRSDGMLVSATLSDCEVTAAGYSASRPATETVSMVTLMVGVTAVSF